MDLMILIKDLSKNEKYIKYTYTLWPVIGYYIQFNLKAVIAGD